MRRIDLETTESTNAVLKEHCNETPELILVTAQYQTAGRGSGSNSWESARGENLLFSLAYSPSHVQAQDSFVLSEALALAVCEALRTYCDGFLVKWPNDIYHDHRKVADLLIENELAGPHVKRCIMGIGLNVNQSHFESDAPNPVSLSSLTGLHHDREEVLRRVLDSFAAYREQVDAGHYKEIHNRYVSNLYRLGEERTYADAKGDFRAVIIGVEPSGHLILQDSEGQIRRYAFKEIIYK